MNNAEIKLLVVDVDGTMTDGAYNVSSNGVITKRFSTHDFQGMMDLQNEGISILILTSSTDDCIKHRFNQLPKVAKFRMELARGKVHKIEYLEEYLKNKGIKWEEVAYMGDDVGDLICMRKAGHTACPADAHNRIQEESNFIAYKKGGYGAIREFIEHYLWPKIKSEESEGSEDV